MHRHPPAELTTAGRSTTVSCPAGTATAIVGEAVLGGGGGRRTGGGGGMRLLAAPGTLLGRGCRLRGAGRM